MNKKLIFIWFVIIVLIGIFVWLYQYVIVAQKKEVAQVHRELAVLEESRRLLKEREVRYASWQHINNQLRDFFFHSDNLVAWLEFLEENARVRDLDFDVVSLDKETAESPLLQTTVSGAFTDVLAFLRASQSGPYGIMVQEGTMRQTPKNNVIMQVTFLFYEASL